MVRTVLSVYFVSLAACASSDAPTISLDVIEAGPTPPELLLRLVRPYGHTFSSPLAATINGVDAGAARVFAGVEGDWPRVEEVPASAAYRLPLTSIERGVYIELVEGDEHFVVEVPDLNAPRAINIHTSLAALRADDWIELDSGVPSDQLAGGFSATSDAGFCFTQWGSMVAGGSISFQLPPPGTFEDCGGTNPVGSTRAVELDVSLWSLTPVTRCEGPGVTCDAVFAPTLSTTVPATLQF
jgi:hypothetical protein